MKRFLTLMALSVLGSMVYYSVISCQTNKPKNLKVLNTLPMTQDMTIEELKEYMRNFTLSLGVECEYCHDTDNYSNDDKKEKLVARDMIRMLAALNDKHFKNAKEEITCYTCHRGAVQIKNTPPGL